MKITITGKPGSGKTTVGKMLAEKLGLDFFSVGDLRGKMAMDRGITIEELNKIGEKESWTDKEADDYVKKYGETHDNFIVEGRLAFHFIPDSIKIFMDVDLRAAAERVFADQRPDEKKPASIDDEMKLMADRVESDKRRYQKYYNLDPYEKKQFDIVLDSTNVSPEEMLENLLALIGERSKK